jgi:hypothetical protein
MVQCNLFNLSGIGTRHTIIRFKLFFYGQIKTLISMEDMERVSYLNIKSERGTVAGNFQILRI